MGMIWYLMRSVWFVGLLGLTVLCVPMIGVLHKEPDVAVPVFIATGIYAFLIGWVVCYVIPQFLKNRIRRRIASLHPDFRPEAEIMSADLRAYVGFSEATGELLYVDGTRIERMRLTDVRGWRLDREANNSAWIRLATRFPRAPLLSIPIARRSADEWEARLLALFA